MLKPSQRVSHGIRSRVHGHVVAVYIWLLLLTTGMAPVIALEGAPPEIATIGLGWLQEAELDPTGEVLATCSDAAIHLWRLNGSLISTCFPGDYPWAGIAWSPQGASIAATDILGQVTIFRSPSMSTAASTDYEHLLHRWTSGLPQAIKPWPVEWSPNGSLIALGYHDGTSLYDSSTGEHLALLPEPLYGFDVEEVEWLPDGDRVVFPDKDGGYAIYDTGSRELIARYEEAMEHGHPSEGEMAVSTDGRWLGIYNGSMTNLYDLATGQVSQAFSVGDDVSAMEWLSGRLLALGTNTGLVLVWDTEAGEAIIRIQAHTGRVLSLSCQGERVASASSDQDVRIWHLETGPDALSLLSTFSGWAPAVQETRWFPDGKSILVSRFHSEDLAETYTPDGRETLRIISERQGDPFWIEVSPDGRMVSTVTPGGTMSIWDARTGARLLDRGLAPGWSCLSWNPDKTGILAMVGLGGVEIWDIQSQADRPVLTIPVPDVVSMDWSSDGQLLVLGRPHGIEVWDASKPTHLVSAPTWHHVSAVAVSPDDTKIACMAGQGAGDELSNPRCMAWEPLAKVQVWDFRREEGALSSAGEITLPQANLGRSATLAWAPNSTMLAVPTGIYQYRTIDRECGVALPGVWILRVLPNRLEDHVHLARPVRPVTSLDWSPDGSMIVAGSSDGITRIWRVGPSGAIGEAMHPILALAFIAAVAQAWILHTRNGNGNGTRTRASAASQIRRRENNGRH